MKLSISWIFDHINARWQDFDIKDLIAKFNRTTAEIEGYEKINIDLDNLFIAQVKAIENENVILSIQELNTQIELPKKANIKLNQFYFVKKVKSNEYDWASSSDFGAQKEMALPSIEYNKDWRKSIDAQDYILEIDNKSITHRPDLWGHRGFAREIAAILKLELLPLDNFLKKQKILDSNQESATFSAKIQNEKACKRFAFTYLKDISNNPSDIKIISRLSSIDSRSINEIVDATNYCMFDIGQPMHAFDADKLNGKNIQARFAIEGERLRLLDDSVIELSSKDLVIADAQGAIALAGIMGGNDTQVDENTKSVLLESACFDASVIRLSSIKHKKRSEASARFEKTLDPNQNTLAIERFLNLINFDKTLDVISLGKRAVEIKINISQEFIDKRLGCEVSKEFIKDILHRLDFKISGQYEITVPSFRASKDIAIPEDIVEEIGRFYGYDNIPFVLPSKQMTPSDLSCVNTIRKIKELMSFACSMHEVINYPFFDESFLNELNWQPESTIKVLSPVSENWQRLVTSLMPHLIKDVKQNLGKKNSLNFYEINKTWKLKDNDSHETNSLSGIFYNYNSQIDFYKSKNNLVLLFDLLKIDVKWEKPSFLDNNNIWFDQNESAALYHNDVLIGHAGMLSERFNKFIGIGNAFIFELNADFLLSHGTENIKFKPLSKYPYVWLDISMFVSLDKTVQQITDLIKNADPLIYKIDLIDKFEKPEWQDKKSLTFRYYFVDENKTLAKEEIEKVSSKVIAKLQNINAQLR